jgi:cation diffusion facilitator CzcD-associated flavoprotein CzcO
MELHDRPFQNLTTDFPDYQTVLAYWQSYVDDYQLREHLVLNTHVRLVEPTPDTPGKRRWTVTLQRVNDTSTSETWQEDFDAVIVCNGHYQEPYVPAISGLESLEYQQPERLLHSLEYRHPETLRNKVCYKR